ncbi:hypothetical protein ACKWTF_014314 [Chironomus riparius]
MTLEFSSILKNLQIILLFCILINCSRDKPQEFARFKSVKCIASNKTFGSNYTCRIRPYNRYVAKLTILVDFRVPTHDAFLDLSVVYKQLTGTSYRVIINKTIDICGYLGGQKDVLMQWLIDLLWKDLPKSLLHPCPYIGLFPLHNVSIALDSMNHLPDGLYKASWHFYNKNDDNIMKIWAIIEVGGTLLKEF